MDKIITSDKIFAIRYTTEYIAHGRKSAQNKINARDKSIVRNVIQT